MSRDPPKPSRGVAHTEGMALVVPSALARAVAAEPSPGRLRWLSQLADTVTTLADRWNLSVGAPCEPGGQTAWVAPVRDPSGRDLVLKVGWAHDEAEQEADGLRAWGGCGTVLIHDGRPLEAAPVVLLRTDHRDAARTVSPRHPTEHRSRGGAGPGHCRTARPALAGPNGRIHLPSAAGHVPDVGSWVPPARGRGVGRRRRDRSWAGAGGNRTVRRPRRSDATRRAVVHRPARRQRARRTAGAVARDRPQAVPRR